MDSWGIRHLLLISSLLFHSASAETHGSQIKVKGLRPLFLSFRNSDRNLIAIRSFERNQIASYLLVDPDTLRTEIGPLSDLRHEVLSWENLLLETGELPSPFFRFPGLISQRFINSSFSSSAPVFRVHP